MQVNNKIENFIEYLNSYSPGAGDPLSYFHAVSEELDSFFSSVLKSFAVLTQEEKSNYLEDIKLKLYDIRPIHSVEKEEIIQILKNYNITYEEITYEFDLFNKNELFQILSNIYNKDAVYDVSHDQCLEIQNKFVFFWKHNFIDIAFEKIESLESAIHKNDLKKGSKGKLNGTEKLLLIYILQESELFPKASQETTADIINETISALTGISSSDQVRKDFSDKISIFHNSTLITTQQRREKIRNVDNIREIIEKLNISKVSEKFKKIEEKVKSHKE